MGTEIEEYIFNGMLQITGNEAIIGLLILGFFAALVLIRNFRLDGKILVLIPAAFLAAAFLPIMFLVIALVGAVILYLGMNKMFNRQ